MPTDRGKRGIRHRMVSYPLLTPPHLPWGATPFGRASKYEGPQGRLVLQGHALDGSGAFRSGKQTPCTGWPRTVMRGKSRKGNSGPESVSKPARRTEPSPRNPRFAAHLRCVSAKEGKGSQEGQGNHLVSLPLLLSPVRTGVSAARRRQFLSPVRTGVSAAEGGNFPESFTKALPEQRPCAPATESAFRSFAARSLLRVPVRRSTAPPCARW